MKKMKIEKIREAIKNLKNVPRIDDEQDDVNKQLAEWLTDLIDCRNELCLLCGKYEHAHKGACNGCRFENEE